MSRLYITTTQNVPLFFTPASVGERMLAFFIDLLIKAAYLITAYLIFLKGIRIDEIITNQDWIIVALLFLLLLPVIFYTLAFETFMEGQTPGKKLVKIKVVKIDGYQASFFDFFTRWIFRIVDIQMSYLPGLISMLMTQYTRRIGDLAAGTAVITEKSKYNISHTILMDVKDDYEPYFSHNQILLFSDNDMRIIKENANSALKTGNQDLMSRLVTKIESVMKVINPFPSQRQFIETLLKDYNHFTGK